MLKKLLSRRRSTPPNLHDSQICLQRGALKGGHGCSHSKSKLLGELRSIPWSDFPYSSRQVSWDLIHIQSSLSTDFTQVLKQSLNLPKLYFPSMKCIHERFPPHAVRCYMNQACGRTPTSTTSAGHVLHNPLTEQGEITRIFKALTTFQTGISKFYNAFGCFFFSTCFSLWQRTSKS